MNFGLLRVLNDDTVAPGMGHGKHPDNMEIISIPLRDLEHKDSMGNKAVIREGEIQAMSAGTGIFHSEYNASKSDGEIPSKSGFREKRMLLHYDQIVLPDLSKANTLHQVLSPNPDDAGIWVRKTTVQYGSFQQQRLTVLQYKALQQRCIRLHYRRLVRNRRVKN